ncbi:hypothetical protein ACVCFC_29885 [Klebsiella oxytoca]
MAWSPRRLATTGEPFLMWRKSWESGDGLSSSLVPENKVRNIELEGCRVVRVGASQDDAMAEVKRAVAEFGMIEIPPFDHPSIIAGREPSPLN